MEKIGILRNNPYICRNENINNYYNLWVLLDKFLLVTFGILILR